MLRPLETARQVARNRIYAETGHLIRRAREAKGVSQDRVAKAVGLSRTSVTNIEKGRQKFLLHTLLEIAVALDVEPQKLVPRRELMRRTLEEKLPTDLAERERQWIGEIVRKGTAT